MIPSGYVIGLRPGVPIALGLAAAVVLVRHPELHTEGMIEPDADLWLARWQKMGSDIWITSIRSGA